jgi:uncharacterized membrane protein
VGTTKQIPRTSRVEVEVAAPVDAVWPVLADVTRTGEWSHECQRVTWLDGATSASYGARFRGDNSWLVLRWSRTNEIIELQPQRVIAWRTVPSWRFPDCTEWRFALEESTVGTRITQTYEVVQTAAWWAWLMARVVPPHRDRSAALAADLRRIGEVARLG